MLLTCLPKRLFSLELIIDSKPVEMQIPRMYFDGFLLRSAQLGMSEQGRFIVAEPKELPSVISVRNLVNAVRKVDMRPVAICWNAMDLGFMHALSSEGVSYIRDEFNAFLPFIGGVISDESLKTHFAAPLSPQSQRVILNYIAGRWVDCTAGDLARLCDKSAASVSGYLSEIAAIAPGLIMRDGKKRILRDVGLSTEALLDGFEEYLRTPVIERIRLKKTIDRAELRAVDALLSGVSALSYMSDLAHDDSAPTVALEKYQVASLKERVGDGWQERRGMNRLLSRLRSGRIPWTSRLISVLARRVCSVSIHIPCTLPAQNRTIKMTVCSTQLSSSGGRYAKSKRNRAICQRHEQLQGGLCSYWRRGLQCSI